MASSSGTYTWNPSIGGIGLYALSRCGVKRTDVTADHLANVQMAANMVLSDWSNDQPNLWTVTLQSISLIASNPGPYTLPTNTVLVLDCYITTTTNGVSTDRVIYPISRSEYASYPMKLNTAPPTVYWMDRVSPPTLTVYPAPDTAATYTLNYYSCSRDQDAALGASGLTDLPYRFLKAFSDCLSAELAIIYAPDRAVALDTVAQRTLEAARKQDREVVPLYIAPSLGGYYR